MLIKQYPGKDFPARSLAHLTESLNEAFSILIIEDDWFTPISPSHHVVDGTFVLNSRGSRHRERRSLQEDGSKIFPCPLFLLELKVNFPGRIGEPAIA